MLSTKQTVLCGLFCSLPHIWLLLTKIRIKKLAFEDFFGHISSQSDRNYSEVAIAKYSTSWNVLCKYKFYWSTQLISNQFVWGFVRNGPGSAEKTGSFILNAEQSGRKVGENLPINNSCSLVSDIITYFFILVGLKKLLNIWHRRSIVILSRILLSCVLSSHFPFWNWIALFKDTCKPLMPITQWTITYNLLYFFFLLFQFINFWFSIYRGLWVLGT